MDFLLKFQLMRERAPLPEVMGFESLGCRSTARPASIRRNRSCCFYVDLIFLFISKRGLALTCSVTWGMPGPSSTYETKWLLRWSRSLSCRRMRPGSSWNCWPGRWTGWDESPGNSWPPSMRVLLDAILNPIFSYGSFIKNTSVVDADVSHGSLVQHRGELVRPSALSFIRPRSFGTAPAAEDEAPTWSPFAIGSQATECRRHLDEGGCGGAPNQHVPI